MQIFRWKIHFPNMAISSVENQAIFPRNSHIFESIIIIDCNHKQQTLSLESVSGGKLTVGPKSILSFTFFLRSSTIYFLFSVVCRLFPNFMSCRANEQTKIPTAFHIELHNPVLSFSALLPFCSRVCVAQWYMQRVPMITIVPNPIALSQQSSCAPFEA